MSYEILFTLISLDSLSIDYIYPICHILDDINVTVFMIDDKEYIELLKNEEKKI